MDLYKLTAHELHDKLVNKEISSVELTENVYSRIDEVEDKVQAYVTLDKENALAQAKKVDEKLPPAKLLRRWQAFRVQLKIISAPKGF